MASLWEEEGKLSHRDLFTVEQSSQMPTHSEHQVFVVGRALFRAADERA